MPRPLLPALLAAAALGPACAASGSDVHLAPVWTRLATAGGGTAVEAAGGAFVALRDEPRGEAVRHALRPLYGWQDRGDGWIAHVLVPLGQTRVRGDEVRSLLFPLYVYGREPEVDGDGVVWSLFALPGILAKHEPETGTEVGWFPFFGRFEDFATFDELTFVLWPLYAYTRTGEHETWNLLWPVLAYGRGGGKAVVRAWPLFGRAALEGRYVRTFALWPFLHLHMEALGPGEAKRVTWMVWPLYGRTTQGTYVAHTLLWPFFGWARDPRSGFWAVDAPWPLVRLRRGPEVHRTRFWPFYGHLAADRLETWTYLWPIVHVREERYVGSERDAFHVLPFWQSWDRLDLETGETSAWRKLWPLFQWERTAGPERDHERGSFPTLDPFQRNELVDFHYGWLWKLWEWEREGALRSERSWLGLWRRERGAYEDRRSLAGLWSRRTVRPPGGGRVAETSLLFGLLRWRRTEDEGFAMLRPAFPGPGWPAERVGPEEGASDRP